MIFITENQVFELDKYRNCPKCHSSNVIIKSDSQAYFKVIKCLDCEYTSKFE